MAVKSFTDVFKEEKDIYVQNLADAQVSCEFPLSEGRVEGFTFPHSRDPVNLTQHLPFAAIKGSTDFRKMLARRPPALQLLEKEEYEAYYKKIAKNRGLLGNDGNPDADAAIDAAEEKRRRTSDKTQRQHVTDKSPEPIHEIIERGSGPGGAARFGEHNRVASREQVSEDEVINPRVLHLCNQVKAEIPEEDRMSAQELLESLQDIPNLKLDDLEHVRAHGYYKNVKKWAKMEGSKLNEEADEEADEKQAEASA